MLGGKLYSNQQENGYDLNFFQLLRGVMLVLVTEWYDFLSYHPKTDIISSYQLISNL